MMIAGVEAGINKLGANVAHRVTCLEAHQVESMASANMRIGPAHRHTWDVSC